jgi:ribosomal protein L37AE/L43A
MAEKRVTCPHCNASVVFKRNSAGRWVGTVAGGGLGYLLAAGLGIAGAILAWPVAIPAAAVGVGIGAIVGNRAGKAVDDARAKCPKCNKSMVL